MTKDLKNTNKPKRSLDIRWGGAYTGKLLMLLIVVSGFTLISLIVVEMLGGGAQFKTLIEGSGAWTPVVYVLLKASTYVFAPLSGTSVKLASGALFGTWEGMLLSLLGDTLGGSINYWIARTFGRTGITKFAGKKALEQVDHATERIGTWKVLLGARLVLSSIYDFISYAAGLAKISFAQFVIVTAVGGIPVSIIFASLGNASVQSSSTSYVLITISAITLIGACLAYLYNRRIENRNRKQS